MAAPMLNPDLVPTAALLGTLAVPVGSLDPGSRSVATSPA